jgi:hypothetical protein
VRPLVKQQTVFNINTVVYLRILQDQLDHLLEEQLDHRLEDFEEHGRLLQGQLRDAVENVREITTLAEQLALLGMTRDRHD